MALNTVKVDLPAEIFDVAVNVPLIHQVVVAQQAAARQGTHKTKNRGEVSGSGVKPFKQKGTGRSRQGSVRAPEHRGGGVVHGPTPRDYSQRTPKKMKAAALRGALSDRAQNGRIHVVDFAFEKPSTKAAAAGLAGLTDRSKFLVVLDRAETFAWLSLRNLPEVHIVAADQVNTYDVLAADDVVFSTTAYDEIVASKTPAPSSRCRSDSKDPQLSRRPDRQVEAPQIATPGVAPVFGGGKLVGTGIEQTSDQSQLFDAAHEAARQQMGIQSYRSTDPTIDGWSVSSEDVEFVAIERHRNHVLVSWPSTLTAHDAVRLFQELFASPDAVYADAGDDYLAFDEPDGDVDWKRIEALPGLEFLRADLGAEVVVWKAPSDEDLQDNRFEIIEPSVKRGQLLQLIKQTTKRDVVALLEDYLGASQLNFEPLDAVG